MKEEILVADLVEVVEIYLKTLLIVSFVFLRYKIIKNLFYFKRLTFILPEAQIREFSLVKKLKFWLFRFHVRRRRALYRRRFIGSKWRCYAVSIKFRRTTDRILLMKAPISTILGKDRPPPFPPPRRFSTGGGSLRDGGAAPSVGLYGTQVTNLVTRLPKSVW